MYSSPSQSVLINLLQSLTNLSLRRSVQGALIRKSVKTLPLLCLLRTSHDTSLGSFLLNEQVKTDQTATFHKPRVATRAKGYLGNESNECRSRSLRSTSLIFDDARSTSVLFPTHGWCNPQIVTLQQTSRLFDERRQKWLKRPVDQWEAMNEQRQCCFFRVWDKWRQELRTARDKGHSQACTQLTPNLYFSLEPRH